MEWTNQRAAFDKEEELAMEWTNQRTPSGKEELYDRISKMCLVSPPPNRTDQRKAFYFHLCLFVPLQLMPVREIHHPCQRVLPVPERDQIPARV